MPVTQECSLLIDGVPPQQQAGSKGFGWNVEKTATGMLMFINCLQKNLYRAVGIEEESKHCSAPGSQCKQIFFPWVPGRKRKAFQCLPPCPLCQWGWQRLRARARQGWDAQGGTCGEAEAMHRAQVNTNKLLERPRQESPELLEQETSAGCAQG